MNNAPLNKIVAANKTILVRNFAASIGNFCNCAFIFLFSLRSIFSFFKIGENLQGNWKANAGGNLAQQVSGTVADTFLTAAVSKSFVDYNRQKDKIAQQEWAKGNYGTAVWEKLKAGGVGLLGAAENTLNAAVDVAYMGSAAIESGFSDKTYAQVRAAQGDTSLTNIAGSIMQPSTPYSSGGQNNQVLNRMDDLEGFLQEFLSRQKKGE